MQCYATTVILSIDHGIFNIGRHFGSTMLVKNMPSWQSALAACARHVECCLEWICQGHMVLTFQRPSGDNASSEGSSATPKKLKADCSEATNGDSAKPAVVVNTQLVSLFLLGAHRSVTLILQLLNIYFLNQQNYL